MDKEMDKETGFYFFDLFIKVKEIDSRIAKKNQKDALTYLMKNSNNGLYKIGKSINPDVREKTLQGEDPYTELIHTINADIEKFLHDKFKKKRVRGEWFKLSNRDVEYIKKH